MKYDWIAFTMLWSFALVITVGIVARWFPRTLSALFLVAALVRGVGSVARFLVVYDYYSGGDASRYYESGLYYARQVWQFDFQFLHDPYWGGRIWGTQMVMYFTGLVISTIGPSEPGAFLAFSLVAFLALVLFAKTFHQNFNENGLRNYAMWLFFWPSLAFWPSAIGKDALILLGSGLVMYGYAANRKAITWIPLILGIGIASVIRPHVAGVLVVSIAVAHWISPTRRWTYAHMVQGVALLIVLSVVLLQGFSRLGVESMDIDDFREYVKTVNTRTAEGGSAIATPGLGITGIPVAIANVLIRPFPWESGNALSLAASAEMIIFWGLVILRRKKVAVILKQWRSYRMLRLAVPLTILYVLMLGMSIGNLGILVRQRVHVMPLLFIWLEAHPVEARVKEGATARRRLFHAIVLPKPSIGRAGSS